VLGAAVAWRSHIPQRIIAAVMAFGSGVLISALSFELMDEALRRGGFLATAAGFLVGAALYTAANIAISRRGAKHRKRSGGQQSQGAASGLAIAVGALLDGIPESTVTGVSLLAGQGVSLVAVIAIFLPEGLSSAAGMKKAGRPALYVFGVWSAIAVISGSASYVGYVAFDGASPAIVAAIEALAAGAILAMIADTLIPEAFEATHDYSGFITVVGFLAAFALSKVIAA
jgi:ZIP family zinc transporter